MQSFKCPMCNRKAVDPINLRCDHHPCFQCASQILAVDQESALETKYKLICPVCYKKTITYDLRHLIINATEQDQDMYVTTKFINKKPEPCLTKKNSEQSKSSQTKQSGASTRVIGIECKKHPGYNLQYLCEECLDKNEVDIYLCGQCSKSHKHRLVSIVNSGDRICSFNQRKRETMMEGKYQMLNSLLAGLLIRKESLAGEFQVLYKEVGDQFKAIYHHVNEQYQFVKRDLKAAYTKHCEEIRANIGLVEKLRQSLKELDKIPNNHSIDLESQVHYSICSIQIDRAIETNKAKLNEKSELPHLIKRNQITGQKLIEVVSGNKQKQISRSTTPTSSARLFHYSFDACKSGRPESRNSDINMNVNYLMKENFNPVSPKNYFSSKPGA